MLFSSSFFHTVDSIYCRPWTEHEGRRHTSRQTGRRTRPSPPPPPPVGDTLGENLGVASSYSSMPLSSNPPGIGLSPNLVHGDQQIFNNVGSREANMVETTVSNPSENDDVADEGRNNASFAEALESHSPFNGHRAFYAGK